MLRKTLIISFIALSACRDADTATQPKEAAVSATVLPCEQQFIPEPGCTDPGGPQGGGINPNDSHVSANVVQSYVTVITDQNTGSADTLPSEPIPYRLEAGYSLATGADLVQHVYAAGESEDGVATIRVDGSTAQELDGSGAPAAAADGDLSGEMVNPLGGMPDLGMFPSVIEAIANGETGAFRVGLVADQMISLKAHAVQVRSGVVVRMVDDTHLDLIVSATRGAGRIGGDGSTHDSNAGREVGDG